MDETLDVKSESEHLDGEQQTALEVVQMVEIENIKCEPEVFEDEAPVTEHETQLAFIKCESEWSMESKEEVDSGEVNISSNRIRTSASPQPSTTEHKECEQNYCCLDCDMTFDNRESLGDHAELVHNKLPCRKCGKAFTRRSHLSEHLKLHSGFRPFCCSLCKKKFSRKADLKRHVQCLHSGERPPISQKGRFSCAHCGRLCSSLSKLRDHLTTHTGERAFHCVVCGKCYRRKHDLGQHMLKHTQGKTFSCDICQRAFFRKSDLRKHLNIHSDRTFQCVRCPSVFTDRANLRSHMQDHLNHLPLLCLTCGQSFTRKFHLKLHQMTHSGDRHYVCNFCSQLFTERGDLDSHMLIHTRERPHPRTS